MKDNAIRLMVITGMICFLAGGVIGYVIRSRAKMTPKEFEYQLGRLDARETGEVIKALERAWGITASPPRLVPADQGAKEK